MGTAGNMQAAFGTSLENFDSPSGSYRGRTGYLTIPANLQDVVAAVLGLDDRPAAKTHLRRARATTSGLSPALVAEAYGFPSGATGAGQTIGIIELGGGYAPADLDTYFSGLGIKRRQSPRFPWMAAPISLAWIRIPMPKSCSISKYLEQWRRVRTSWSTLRRTPTREARPT